MKTSMRALAMISVAMLPTHLYGQTVVELDPISIALGEEQADSDTNVASQASSASKITTDLLTSSASVSVVTQAEISQRDAQSIEDILSYTAGVSVNEFGSDNRYDYFRIRGFYSGLLLSDGLPVRYTGWSYGKVEPYGLSRAEILKGSNSALFGLASPGGIINLVSKTPKGEKFGEAYLSYGPKTTEIGTDFGDILNQDGTLSYRVTAKVKNGEYDYETSQDDSRFLQAGLTWKPTNATSLNVTAFYDERDGTPGNGVASGIDPDEFQGDSAFNSVISKEKGVSYAFDHNFGNGLSFTSKGRVATLDYDLEQSYYSAFTSPSIGAFSSYGETNQTAIDNQLLYKTDFNGVGSQTLVGVEYNNFESEELANYGTVGSLGDYYDWEPSQTSTAIYLQQELDFGKYIATFGGRYDWVNTKVVNNLYDYTIDVDDEAFSGRFGLTYKYDNTLTFYGNYSESISQDPFNVDAGLDPSEGTQYEIGLKYSPANMNALFTVALYDLTRTNIGQWDYVNGVYEYTGAVNVRGVELEAKFELFDNFNFIGAYTYLDAEVTEDATASNVGNKPAQTPDQLLSLWGDYTLEGSGSRGDMNFGLGVRYVGESFGDEANTTQVGDYAQWDASFGYEVSDNVDLSLNVTNLFDDRSLTTSYYGTENYTDGRTVTATLKYTW